MRCLTWIMVPVLLAVGCARSDESVPVPYEALLLAEGYREASRIPRVQEGLEELRRRLAEAESGATELEGILRKGKGNADKAAEEAYQKAGAACARCHARYRDVPHDR